MSKVVKIPDSMNPFVVIINGVKHEYPSGVEMEVPDNVAAIIEGYEKGNFPQPAVPATVINMISPGGKQFELTISDDGELTVIEKKTGGEADLITFTIDGVEYQAEEGMTWGEFVASDYNSDFTCDCGGTSKKFFNQTDRIAYNYNNTCGGCDGVYPEIVIMDEDDKNYTTMTASDAIIAGCAYVAM